MRKAAALIIGNELLSGKIAEANLVWSSRASCARWACCSGAR